MSLAKNSLVRYAHLVVTLNVRGPLSVIIITTMPDDFAVRNFIDLYKEQLDGAAAVLDTIECRNTDQMLAGFKRVAASPCSGVLFVTHGDELGQPVFQDPAFDALPVDIRFERKRGMLNWIRISSWFRDAIDDRIFMLAVCNAGAGSYTHTLLHTGMALHVLTAFEGTTIQPPAGPRALVHFTKDLAQPELISLSPEMVEAAMDNVEAAYPNVLDLWPYLGGTSPQKYIPRTRR